MCDGDKTKDPVGSRGVLTTITLLLHLLNSSVGPNRFSMGHGHGVSVKVTVPPMFWSKSEGPFTETVIPSVEMDAGGEPSGEMMVRIPSLALEPSRPGEKLMTIVARPP